MFIVQEKKRKISKALKNKKILKFGSKRCCKKTFVYKLKSQKSVSAQIYLQKFKGHKSYNLTNLNVMSCHETRAFWPTIVEKLYWLCYPEIWRKQAIFKKWWLLNIFQIDWVGGLIRVSSFLCLNILMKIL